jgi:hypothetical protein
MKKIFIIAILSVFTVVAYSQSGITSLTYSMGFGTGNMHDYISKASFRGFTVDYRGLVRSNVGLGVELGWNVFYDELPDAEYDYRNLTLSGKQWRTTNHFPILLGADYYFNPDADMTPFAGFGLGTMYSLQNTDMSLYTLEKDAWQFAIRPEVGLIFKPAPGVGFNISSKYYYGFKGGELDAQGFFTINVGFVFAD